MTLSLLYCIAGYLYMRWSKSHQATARASGRPEKCSRMGLVCLTWCLRLDTTLQNEGSLSEEDLRDPIDFQDLETLVEKVATVRIQTVARALSTTSLAVWMFENCMVGVFLKPGWKFVHQPGHAVNAQRCADAMMSGVPISSSGGGKSHVVLFWMWLALHGNRPNLCFIRPQSSDSSPEHKNVSIGRGRQVRWWKLCRPSGATLCVENPVVLRKRSRFLLLN